MSKPEDIERLVSALKTVPEKRLLIIDLANEAVNGKGELDYDLLSERQPEVNLAVAEAKAYSHSTQRLIEALKNLPARYGDVEWEP